MNDDILKQIRIDDFIDSFSIDEAEYLTELKTYAKNNDVPIIRDRTIEFLRMIINIKKPKNILEIGTAIGFSALVMKNELNDVHIDTIEDYEKRIVLAKENFNKYCPDDSIKLYPGDATEYLEKWISDDIKEKYDFVFLDAAKGQYIKWLPSIIILLKPDGILLTDNVFKDGEILEDKLTIEKRDRTIHKRMREFLYEITHNPKLKSYIYDIGDGISISIKKSY